MKLPLRGAYEAVLPTSIEPIRSGVANSTEFCVCRYSVYTQKCSAPVRIALLSDLHNTSYGRQQQRLIRTVSLNSPDLIACSGDLFDAHERERHTLTALAALSERFPCYYVIGNHERHNGREKEIKRSARRCGATVLENGFADLTLPGGTIRLLGLEDYSESKSGLCERNRQLVKLDRQLHPNHFNVLLHHRPEHFADLLAHGYDLMLSGHTHGGQWRVPLAANGLYAPGQGLFPAYAGGQFSVDGRFVIISRGLSKKPVWIPRIGNPPELVIVELIPSLA